MEIIGILLFLTGSFLNTASEYFRFSWKQKKENTGHLYTGGLFKYARHINYFGDIVLFTGMAMVAHQIQLLIIPISMAFVFVVILISAANHTHFDGICFCCHFNPLERGLSQG
jgi:steroid 5-alpha reductase family enzyme